MTFNSSQRDADVLNTVLGAYAVFAYITAPISVCNLTLSYGQQATIYVNQTGIPPSRGSGSWPRAAVCIATQIPHGPPIGECLPVYTNTPTQNSTDAFIVTTGSECPTAPCTSLSIQLRLKPGDTALVQIMQGCASSTCTGVTHVDISSLPSPPSILQASNATYIRAGSSLTFSIRSEW